MAWKFLSPENPTAPKQEAEFAPDRRAAFQADYESCGVTIESVRELLEKLRWADRDQSHEEAFYVTSSDNLPALRERVDVKDKTVSTVASNGDFWQIFAEGGAKRVDIFDISLPAIMYSELKVAGLENLSFDDYLKMFGGGRTSLEEMVDGGAFFDRETYRKLRDRLTPQAQTYFDRLLDDEFRESITMDHFQGFVRIRKNNIFVGDLVRDAETYERLQKNSRETEYGLSVQDATKGGGSLPDHDVVYLSNIGYRLDASLELAAKLAAKGAEVLISTNPWRIINSDEARGALANGFNPGDRFDNHNLGVRITLLDCSDKALEGVAIVRVTKLD